MIENCSASNIKICVLLQFDLLLSNFNDVAQSNCRFLNLCLVVQQKQPYGAEQYEQYQDNPFANFQEEQYNNEAQYNNQEPYNYEEHYI